MSQTLATSNGEVDPNGAEVGECELEYGATASYGSSAPCSPSPGSGNSPVAVSAALSGLAANSTYHYRITAANGGGVSFGKDVSFKTLPNPPTVVTVAASGISQTAATSNGEVDANGAEVGECELEYGATASYGSSVPCSPPPGSGSSAVAVSAALSGLAANSTYHYRITAANGGGVSFGKDVSFKTLPNPPTVVTVAASGVAQTTATLEGEVDPNGAEASECTLEYGATTEYGASVPCAPPPGSGSSPVAVSASLSGLAVNSTYHYRITATNGGGVSFGEDSTFNTLPNPPTVLSVAASAIAQTTATLNGEVDPNGAEVSECTLEYGATSSYGSSAPCSPSPGSGNSPVAVSASLSGLAANSSYHYRIMAANGGGVSFGKDVTLKTLPNPPTVTTGAPSGISQTAARLNAEVNPNGAEASECRLEYGTSPTYGSELPCSPSPGSGNGAVSVSAALTGLLPRTTYDYRVVATNAGGTGYGAERSFTTLPEAPVVTGVTPDAGLTSGGTSVTITGSNFIEVQAVKFGTRTASSFTVNSQQNSITAVAPAGLGTVDVTVVGPGGSSPAVPGDRFSYVSSGAGPTLRLFSPTEGPTAGGTEVTITGKQFYGVTAVDFGTTPASSYMVSSGTSIVAISPPEPAGKALISVTTPNGTETSQKLGKFTFAAGPAVPGALGLALGDGL